MFSERNLSQVESRRSKVAYRPETKRVGSHWYVAVQYLRDKAGHESIIVRPDGHGAYPEQLDVDAAVNYGLFFDKPWGSPDDIALVLHHREADQKKWLHRATESMLAANPDRTPGEATKQVGMIIKALYDLPV